MGRGSSGAGKGGGKVLATNKDAEDYFTSPPPPGGSYGDWHDNLTAMEDQSVWDYTGAHYVGINKRLREGTDLGAYKTTVECIDDALAKFELKDDIKVYRGTTGSALKAMFGDRNITAEEINKNFKGAKIKDKGYMSTATNPGASFGGAANFEITVRKGKGKGAFVAPMSQHKSESEFLVRRNAPLRVKGARYDRYGDLIIELEY